MRAALPKRDSQRIETLCNGTISLAELADRRGLPSGLSGRFQSLSQPCLLPKLLESVNRKRPRLTFGNREFLNCLLGGFRPGFNDSELSALTLRTYLEKEHAKWFPRESREWSLGFPSRSEQIKKIAYKSRGPGLHVTFHHWTDLALEMWGDLIHPTDAFEIDLMVIASDAYSVEGVANGALHRYYDSNVTWRNLWQVLMSPGHPRPSYRTLAGEDDGSVGIIDYTSAVGRAMRSWRVWPTNAIPYLRNWPNSVGGLPSAVANDSVSVDLLAYQIWLLRPRNILVTSYSDEVTMIVDHAVDLVIPAGLQAPQVYRVPHSGNSPFFTAGPAVLTQLRARLPRVH